MPESVKYRFGIDIYYDREFQGTSFIDVDIYRDDAEILSMCSTKEERLPARNILADTYALALQMTYEQEKERWLNREYPYSDMRDFEDYSLKIFT